MGETTLTVSQATRDRLDAHRAPGHDTVEDALVGMMEMLPPVEDIEGGCSNADCDRDRLLDGRPERTGGVIQCFHTVVGDNDVYGSAYFCSVECAAEAQARVDEQVPEKPDRVVVGGKDELRASFEGATFYLDRDTREVGIPVPGAFDGSDSHGGTYDYEGEPVYIYNADQWVQSGVIDDIIHEESHTALMLDKNLTVEGLNHPDPDKREAYLDDYAHWYDMTCPECGADLRVCEDMDAEIGCSDCGATVDRAAVPFEDIPDAVLEYREESGAAVPDPESG